MTRPSSEHLLFETDSNGIALLTINRPDKLNALNSTVLEELSTAVEYAEETSEIRVLIITGSGEKAFVAGADIKELQSLDKKTGEKLSLKGQQNFQQIENCSKPVIALVNGYALGGGAELAMACHIRVATNNAVFGLPEVTLGLIPGYGGTQRLAQLVGKSKAMEMILTGQTVKAEQALELGLINHVVSNEEALNFCKGLAAIILKNAPLALSGSISAINAAFTKKGFAEEAAHFGRLCDTEDFKEGTTAFLEKRKAEFKGK